MNKIIQEKNFIPQKWNWESKRYLQMNPPHSFLKGAPTRTASFSLQIPKVIKIYSLEIHEIKIHQTNTVQKILIGYLTGELTNQN